jgi:hypothetical protein
MLKRKDLAGEAPTPDAVIDRQVADMRELLSLMTGASAAESLKALRAAFPDATLATRTSEIADRRF